MATPLGHALAGATVGVVCDTGASLRKRIAVGAFAAMAADLDFLPGLVLGEPARFHHAASHSLLFPAAIGLFAAIIFEDARLRWGLLVAGAYATHLLLDFFTWDNSVPQGIPLLWPASTQTVQSSVPLLPNVVHSQGLILNLHNAAVAVRELAVLGPILLAVLYARHWFEPETNVRESTGTRGPQD